ncbi:MAG TPA: rod shape-determining protein MreC [Candidatus Limnocylindrales bacterium]|nr:rod shape-determining protein MreC [Candidatus Limnocylindrales bacterium]
MHKTKNFLPTFLILLAITILLIILSKSGILNGPTSFLEKGTVPIQRVAFGILTNHDESSGIEKLRVENSKLISELVKQKELVRENQALRDQFQTSNPALRKLIPSKVIGQKIDKIIIDKGFDDGVEKGDSVVYKDNLVGKISKSSAHISIVDLPMNKNIFFTAKILDSSTQGVVKGNENGIILDNVVLSEKIKKGEIVVTKGNIDEDDKGFPPNLVVGKVVSVNKKASSLFQTAEIKSLVDFSKIETVFVIIR